jgi:hypothetical protein
LAPVLKNAMTIKLKLVLTYRYEAKRARPGG